MIDPEDLPNHMPTKRRGDWALSAPRTSHTAERSGSYRSAVKIGRSKSYQVILFWSGL